MTKIKRELGDSLLSIIIPFYNEEDCIQETLIRTIKYMSNLKLNYEIILVNDGSKDDSKDIAIKTLKYLKLKKGNLINLSRNFGKEAALSAGLKYAAGRIIIPMDADLQDPPEIIGEMIEKWQEGYDVVDAVRSQRKGDPFLKRISSFYFYRILKLFSNIDISKDTGDFRLLDRKVVQSILLLSERTRFLKGIYSWVGYKKTSINFNRNSRIKSKSHFSYFYLFNHAIDGITSFSKVPLKIVSSLGILFSIFSISYALYLATRTLISGIVLPGYASIITAILFLGGIQLVCLGILGEYLGRIFEEVKKRPLYLVDSKEEISSEE